MSGMISLEFYKEGLEGALLEIRNHPSVRAYMVNQAPISMQEHLEWVKVNLDPFSPCAGETRLAFIVFNGNRKGFVLLRDIEGDCGEVGIMIRDSDDATGLGAIAAVCALEKLCFDYFGLNSVTAKANPSNHRVIRMLQGLGCDQLESDDNQYAWFNCRSSRCKRCKTYQYLVRRYGPQVEVVF
jgi:RimJ/RimL family protein N-acetyltransferase